MFKSCSSRTIPAKSSYCKICKLKSTAVQKVQDQKKTGGGPPVVMSPAENLWYDLFHDTVYCTGIVDHENFQEVGLGGNIFT